MCAHPSSAAVQEAACGALGRITRPAENQLAAVSAGAIGAAVAAMKAHGAHAGVQEQACWVLRTMAANNGCAWLQQWDLLGNQDERYARIKMLPHPSGGGGRGTLPACQSQV
jgi:hypothetical protein